MSSDPLPERDGSQPAGVVAGLVAAAAAGDPGTWEAIVRRFAGLVWSVGRAHRLDAADASDMSQLVWLRLVENLGRINEPDRLGAWLAIVARNECLRILRKAARQDLVGADLDPTVDPDGLERLRRSAALIGITERSDGLL